MTQEFPSPKKHTRTIIVAVILVLVVVAAVAGYLFYAPATITLSIRDPPPQTYSSSIFAIYVKFTSVEVHIADAGNSTGWHQISQSTTVNLLTVLNVSKILNKANLPAGKYTEFRFNLSEAIVTLNNVNVTYNIPSGSFKVPITGGGFQVVGGQNVNVELDLSFRDSEILAMNGNLTPVATAKVV